jgi:hypothetical protein
MLEAKGLGKVTLIFDGDTVIIKHKGFARHLVGEKTILIENIVEINFNLSSRFSPGYIRFATAASQAMVAPIEDDSGNAVFFDYNVQENFIAIKEAIDEARKNIKKPSSGQVLGVADELKKLLELKELGVLSEKEFEKQKKKLL